MPQGVNLDCVRSDSCWRTRHYNNNHNGQATYAWRPGR